MRNLQRHNSGVTRPASVLYIDSSQLPAGNLEFQIPLAKFLLNWIKKALLDIRLSIFIKTKYPVFIHDLISLMFEILLYYKMKFVIFYFWLGQYIYRIMPGRLTNKVWSTSSQGTAFRNAILRKLLNHFYDKYLVKLWKIWK